MNCSTPGLPVHHQLPEFTQTHVHRVSDAIQPSHPLSSPSPPAFSLSQHQGLFQRVRSWHQVAKVLELQLQHQPFHLQQCYSTFFPVSLQRHQWRCKDVLLCFLDDAQNNKKKRLKEASWVHRDPELLLRSPFSRVYIFFSLVTGLGCLCHVFEFSLLFSRRCLPPPEHFSEDSGTLTEASGCFSCAPPGQFAQRMHMMAFCPRAS